MENDSKIQCFNKEHEKSTTSKFYCAECNIYMCSKCEAIHSNFFKSHKQYNLDKTKDFNKIFTGFCKEENHLEKLDYFCKTHNKLCCSSCIVKIKRKGKGQHTDCNICTIEDIKDEKKDTLNKNIISLKELNKTINESIKELENIFGNINQNKDDLKLTIQKIFTNIRNKINEREDELMLEIDKLYAKTYFNEDKIKEMPNILKESLEKGNIINKEWNEENKLSLLINDCVNIENDTLNIIKVNEILEKCKNGLNSSFKFYPQKQEDINKLLSNFNTIGKIYKTPNNLKEESEITDLDVEIRNIEKEPNEGISIDLIGFQNDDYDN